MHAYQKHVVPDAISINVSMHELIFMHEDVGVDVVPFARDQQMLIEHHNFAMNNVDCELLI